MLQIRLSRPGSASENAGGPRTLPGESVTVACPDHLVLADLPVAKSIGTSRTASRVKIIGRRARRHLGERVHFCVRCDFPIAIYGRLNPCNHAFCLDCARSDLSCFLCDQRIQKIQTIKLMEGILICAAPHCYKSFMKKSDFESHLHEYHSHLLPSNAEEEDGDESNAVNVTRPSSADAHSKQPAPADSSTARAPPKTVISASSNSLPHEYEDKSRSNQPREQMPSKPPIIQLQPPSSPFPYHPMHSHPPPRFIGPVTTNPGPVPPFKYPPFPAKGAQSFYNAPYEIVRPKMSSEGGSDPSSLLGFPPTPSGGTGFGEGNPQPWSMGLAGMPFEQMQLSQGSAQGYANQLGSQGTPVFFQGDCQRVPGMLPLQPPLMPPIAGKALEFLQCGSASDDKAGITVLTPETMPPLPLPPPPPHFSQLPPQGIFSHSGDTGHARQN